MRKATAILVAFLVLIAGLPALLARVDSQLPAPVVSSPVRSPDRYHPPEIQSPTHPFSEAEDDDLRAVAIVGDFDEQTEAAKDDMDTAVAALQNHGVSVTSFYYGDTSFTWDDVVAAARGAHFLLYMGHGVHGWIGSSYWGGFYFGDSDFDGYDNLVSPEQIRTDLGGILASNSAVIFSHACFTAGGPPPDLPQADAAERVHSYAQPFIDIGVKGYFANNYTSSAAQTVDLILSDKTMEEVFKGGVAYDPDGLVDLTYPTASYDLWLDRCAYANGWNLAFVGVPGFSFRTGMPTSTPELTSTPTATPTSTSLPTATSTSTSTPVPSWTPTASATSAATPSPTSSPTPSPSSTSTTSPSPTPTASPTETSTPTHPPDDIHRVYIPVVLRR